MSRSEYDANEWMARRDKDMQAAAELRRLHEVNAALLEALSRLMVHANWMQSCSQDDDEIERDIARARAAIAKAEGETK